MRGYQYLKNNFFTICRKRRITKIAMLLLIYLRGLYAYYGRPTFFYKDEQVMRDLGMSRNTLKQARGKLQERGVVDFYTYRGRGKATRYLILETDLAPEIKLSKSNKKGSKSDTFPTQENCQKLTPSINNKNKPLDYGKKYKKEFNKRMAEFWDKGGVL